MKQLIQCALQVIAQKCTISLCIAVLLFVSSGFAQSGSTSNTEVGGSGTTNFLAKWTSNSTIGNSALYQTGGNVGVGTTTPGAKLDVIGRGFFGIRGSTSSADLYATGVYGQSASPTGNGVAGEATATSGVNNGVFGRSASPNGFGVSGAATSTTGGTGVYGQTVSPGGAGVSGNATATTGNAPGVYGQTASTDTGAGVNGNATATTGNGFGVFGSSASPSGHGVFGYASAPSGSPLGVVGFIESPSGVAGQFVAHSGSGLILQGVSGTSFQQVFTVDAQGNGFFAGNLSKGSGSFKIDHPLDPANKYLSHSFVESPDMMNVYNGIVVLDAHGAAWVKLPEYFEVLNRDYRYQLTSIGAPGPSLYIAKEISDNRFKISGGKPHAKVSWQVTGIRQDAYANARRIQVEEEKPANERGTYLHPELFGKSAVQTLGLVGPPIAELPSR